MTTIIFYAINVLMIAFPLAVSEIWLERWKTGWNGEFRSPFWGKKIRFSLLTKTFEKAYVTPYHLTMFGLVVPTIYVIEFAILRHFSEGGWWILSLGSMKIVPVIFFPAVWCGVAVLEDFLWFALNWHFKDALSRLFHAELAWHTHYWRITPTVQLPRSYFTGTGCAIGLLVVQHIVIRISS